MRASLTTLVAAPVDEVIRLYLDYSQRPRLLGETIRTTRLLDNDGETETIEVTHVEGASSTGCASRSWTSRPARVREAP